MLFSMTTLPAEAQVEATWFDKVETMRAPFELKVGVGR
jgi:hypothetical protein